MELTRGRFEEGLSYDAYKAQMTRNRDQFETEEQSLVLDRDDLTPFLSLPTPLNVLVLTEDWCGAAVESLPLLAHVARESGNLEIRIFLRDQHPDLMDQYLSGQNRTIPVVVFFDSAFQELGHWIEHPAIMRNEISM